MGRRSLWIALLVFSLLLSLRPHTVSSTLPLQSSNQGSKESTSESQSTPKQDRSNAHEVHCLRERSRAAWKIVEESRSKCLADLCGALHCDHVLDTVSQKTKCNPGAAARNKHALADGCFPIDEVTRALRPAISTFCDAHTCSGKPKPFSRGRQVRTIWFYVVISILTIIFVLFFYVFICLYKRGMRTKPQVLKRLSESGRKKKPS